jgi:hypothetical protein
MTDVASRQDSVSIADTNSDVTLLELRQVDRRLVTSTREEMIYTIKELEMAEQSPKDVRKEEKKKVIIIQVNQERKMWKKRNLY